VLKPSGEQWELARGDHRAVIVEVGGGIREYEAGGQAVLDGYADDEMCTGSRGQALIPWPNRLADGNYTFDGRTMQVPINEVGKRTAIHGLVRWARWQLEGRSADRLAVTHVLYPQPAYPFTLGSRIEYALEPDGLSVTVTGTNLGQKPLPYATGHHPYLTLGEPAIDIAMVEMKAAHAVSVDERSLPTGIVDVAAAGFDFRAPRVLGGARIDMAFTALERDGAGRAWVNMQTQDGRRQIRVWLGPAYTHVMLFTGDTLDAVARRRKGLAVEPMTCPPNAFASGQGVIRLNPGESHSASWGMQIT
jgi:aldose 1-epimerase